MISIPDQWDAWIQELPGANLLQTQEWAGVKASGGWSALPKIWRDSSGILEAAALILRKQLKFGGFSARLNVLYAPRGPLLRWEDPGLRSRILNDLQSLAIQTGAIFLKIDPEVVLGWGVPGASNSSEHPAGIEIQNDLAHRGWRFSNDQIQFRNTAVLDLSGSEEEWLARMKQKTRYNIHLAERKGVKIRRGNETDFPFLYRMYAETAVRDGFVIRPEWYYCKVWSDFARSGMCIPLIAESGGEILSGLLLFVFAGRAWYLYGMSRDIQREKMPNYLLQWEAMRIARAAGALEYDLWGAPDTFDPGDPMWGVFRFKEGLGARVVRTLGAWDYPARPFAYAIYTRILPRILNILRRRGVERTRREVSA